MSLNDHVYAEHPNGRLYEVVTVDGYPQNARCHVDHARQRVEFSAAVPASERAALLARAFGQPAQSGWRLVPVVGRVA